MSVAVLNAICWSIVTPPFQAPDEPDHFAYVKQLAETESLPTENGELSVEEKGILGYLHNGSVRENPPIHTLASRGQEHELQDALAEASQLPASGSPGAGVAASEPPLYYAVEAIPYSLVRGGSILDRLELMRIVSALFAGLTAMLVFLFVRELLPGVPWAWTVGGLGTAVSPLLGFMSGAVNPDSMLFAVAAGLFYLLARAFRRGLSSGGAVAIGIVTAIGFLTKLNFIGLFPAMVVGSTVLAVRAARTIGPRAYWRLAIALGIGMSPVIVYVGLNLISGHEALGAATLSGESGSLTGKLSYIWQLYLPRLPGMTNDFPGLSTTRQIWFNYYVGLYGWLDTPFPNWVDSAALVPAGAILLLLCRALLRSRASLRAHLGEIVVYSIAAVGLMALIGASSYRQFPGSNAEFAQTRYLLPLLPLFGVGIALAARGAGRRWGPAVGALIVVLFLAHDIFSQLQVVARYYG